MPFEQKILQEISCPRCNAVAQKRLDDRKDGYAIIYLRCDKCRLRKNLGVTTRKAIKLKKRQEKLRASANQVKSPLVRSRILKQIELLEQKIRQAEVI